MFTDPLFPHLGPHTSSMRIEVVPRSTNGAGASPNWEMSRLAASEGMASFGHLVEGFVQVVGEE